jgi:hypothetical protein
MIVYVVNENPTWKDCKREIFFLFEKALEQSCFILKLVFLGTLPASADTQRQLTAQPETHGTW